jgi:Ca2+/H+ antiporter
MKKTEIDDKIRGLIPSVIIALIISEMGAYVYYRNSYFTFSQLVWVSVLLVVWCIVVYFIRRRHYTHYTKTEEKNDESEE